MNTPFAQQAPWFREPWPWLLMAGPAAVILAGAITVYLALASNDGLVADDYYKRGLAINQTLARDAVAQKLDYHARVELVDQFGKVNVSFGSDLLASDVLVLRFAHPGRPAFDRLLVLTRQGDRRYTGTVLPLTTGRWQVTLEDAARSWRLVGDVVVPGRASVALAPR